MAVLADLDEHPRPGPRGHFRQPPADRGQRRLVADHQQPVRPLGVAVRHLRPGDPGHLARSGLLRPGRGDPAVVPDEVEVDLSGHRVEPHRRVVLRDRTAVRGPVQAAHVLPGQHRLPALLGEEELHVVVEALGAQRREGQARMFDGVQLRPAEGHPPHPGRDVRDAQHRQLPEHDGEGDDRAGTTGGHLTAPSHPGRWIRVAATLRRPAHAASNPRATSLAPCAQSGYPVPRPVRTLRCRRPTGLQQPPGTGPGLGAGPQVRLRFYGVGRQGISKQRTERIRHGVLAH